MHHYLNVRGNYSFHVSEKSKDNSRGREPSDLNLINVGKLGSLNKERKSWYLRISNHNPEQVREDYFLYNFHSEDLRALAVALNKLYLSEANNHEQALFIQESLSQET